MNKTSSKKEETYVRWNGKVCRLLVVKALLKSPEGKRFWADLTDIELINSKKKAK